MRQLVYTRTALGDLDAIFDFIAADNPRRAVSYIDEIRGACSNLRHTPLMGVDRPDLRTGARTLSLWRQIIIVYELPPERVDILRVLSGRRDYEAILRRAPIIR